MARDEVEHYLSDRSRLGDPPAGAYSGASGGAPCGDLVRVSVLVEAGEIGRVRVAAEGCATARAAAAAVAEMAEGRPALDAARIGAHDVAEALGGLGPGATHAADLSADALHRALGAAAGAGVRLTSSVGPPETLVAMSGGVDSAAAALLCAKQGRVAAVTLKLWSDPENDGKRSCCSPDAVLGARALAHKIGLPHLTLDLEDAFRAGVVDRFLAGHAAGDTPNPCILCNGEVRLDAMIELAERLGAGGLATGHYARVEDDGKGPLLAAPADAAKDQTYMLAALPPRRLARMRFPLGRLRKRRAREICAEAGLAVATAPESQDLCFLAGVGKRRFLERHAGLDHRPGEVVDADGLRIGTHPGHHNFTVGQRRGLGVPAGRPLYVLRTDADTNRVVAGSREQLETTRIGVRDAVLHRDGEVVDAVRLRYHAPARGCRLRAPAVAAPGRHDRLELELDERSARVAPGQTAALMQGEKIVGHGTVA